MPYIITNNLPGTITGLDGSAVATIEEARNCAEREIGWSDIHDLNGFVTQALNLPESGDTIGPLPDGYIIEVQKISWMGLIQRTGQIGLNPRSSDSEKRARILEAYNSGKRRDN